MLQTASEQCQVRVVEDRNNNIQTKVSHKKSYSDGETGETLFMGLDVHKKSWTATACTFEIVQGTNEVKGSNDLLEILNAVPLAAQRVVYEAGFSWFWLQRELEKRNIDCMVTLPALVPVRVVYVPCGIEAA